MNYCHFPGCTHGRRQGLVVFVGFFLGRLPVCPPEETNKKTAVGEQCLFLTLNLKDVSRGEPDFPSTSHMAPWDWYIYCT